VFVDDDPFTRALVLDGLSSAGLTVRACGSAAEALELIAEDEPNVLISDLDLGPGPSGADLLRKVDSDWPWIGTVALTAHASVELAVGDGSRLPSQTQYVVKSELASVSDLCRWVENALLPSLATSTNRPQTERVAVTPAQAAAVRLIAEGLSNAAIAERRGITIRSAESLVHRTFQALGLDDDAMINPRVIAAMMWRDGRIMTRAPSGEGMGQGGQFPSQGNRERQS